MKMMTPCDELMAEDAQSAMLHYAADFAALEGKSIFFTGATGLIGYNFVTALLTYAEKAANPPQVIALVRNRAKAEACFSAFPQRFLTLVEGDVTQPVAYDGSVDYIVHAASQTGSKAFVEQPVDTVAVALDGTRNMLNFAVSKGVRKFVYLSTMEVYGAPLNDEKIDESHGTNLNTMEVRSSYPESKRLCETLCAAYGKQFQVPVCVLRLTQTFGPGVRYNDGRVFAEFARCVMEKRDIVLHTAGETKRNYLYTADAVTAIIKLLSQGEPGQAYNAANEETYCSIMEMARLVAGQVAHQAIQVRCELADISAFGYAPPLKMNLDTAKLRALGWQPTQNLCAMFTRLIAAMHP